MRDSMGRNLLRVSEREQSELHEGRRSALLSCPTTRLSDDGRYVVGPVGIRGTLHIAGRSRDGSIVAAVRIWNERRPRAAGYVRRLRVTTHEQPSSRDRYLAIAPENLYAHT